MQIKDLGLFSLSKKVVQLSINRIIRNPLMKVCDPEACAEYYREKLSCEMTCGDLARGQEQYKRAKQWYSIKKLSLLQKQYLKQILEEQPGLQKYPEKSQVCHPSYFTGLSGRNAFLICMKIRLFAQNIL